MERSREKDAKNLQVKLALMDFEKNKESQLRHDLDDDLQQKASKRQEQMDDHIRRQQLNDAKVEAARLWKRTQSVADADATAALPEEATSVENAQGGLSTTVAP